MPHDAILHHPYMRATGALVAASIVLLGGWLIAGQPHELRLESYLPLHAFLETCSIVVCVLVFVAGRASIAGQRNRNMTLLAAAFLGVALLDFLHTYSYLGMPVLVTPSDPEKAINFWLAARLLAASALLATAWLAWEALVPSDRLWRWTALVLAGVAVVSAVVLLRPGWLPRTFVPGSGLTDFKIWMEWAIIGLGTAAAWGYWRMARQPRAGGDLTVGFDPVAVLAATIVTTAGEVFFTVYSDVSGIFNVVGHVYKVIGAWFLCRGLVASNLYDVELRARLALEAADLGAWTWNIATDQIEWDRKAEAIWRQPPEIRPTMQAIDALVHTDDLPRKRSALHRALDPAGDGTYLAEYRITSPVDGSLRHVASLGRIVFSDGKPVRLVGVVRDITARRQAEQSIVDSEARLSGILAIAADAIVSTDEQQRITLFNKGAERIFGYTAEEAIGQKLDILLPERSRGVHSEHVRGFARAGVQARLMGERSEIFGRRKDGSEFPAEASISKFLVGTEHVFTVVLRDTTARVERDRAVKKSEERLTLALDAGHIGLFEHDLRTGNLYWSPIYREIIGVGENEPASFDRIRALVPEEDRGRLDHVVKQVREADRDVKVTLEHRIVRPDGQMRWLVRDLNTHTEDEGANRRVVRIVGVVRDITGRKKVEEELAVANRELERRVGERTAQLEAEMERREATQAALAKAQRMEAIGQLTGGVAHDFNNLLTVISGNQELLEMRLTDPRDLAILKRAQEASAMGARLTSRMLTFARRRPLAPTLINLNDQVSGMAELLRRSIGEHVTLTTNFAPNIGAVRADPSEIENAILNLAINARDAMPGGGSLVIETDECTIGDSDAELPPKLAPGRYVRLSVSDTGIGMAPEVLARAFEPFFTTKQPGRGTGLGLSTIYGFAHELGGTATIYSEVGRGTSVSIYLPRVEEGTAVARPVAAGSDVPVGAGQIVLLVEDNPDVREVARRHLEALGYRVVEADSGPAAVARLEAGRERFDLVFSDVVMPGGMSGYDVARWVGEHRPGLRVLLTSGYPDEVARSQGVSLPVARLLRKPYSRTELARALAAALE
jgi:PAS domain S-box-containing protein